MRAAPKTRRRRKPSMPPGLHEAVVKHIRSITRRYRDAFKGNPELKARVLRLNRALLLPRPNPRGRPGNPNTTHAIALYRKFRRKFPQEKRRATWARVYPLVIANYDQMGELERQTARDGLRERVSWRRRRKPR
jgi:hypothetical protein